jgi:uncharacterized small protein (DUF1192 family)
LGLRLGLRLPKPVRLRKRCTRDGLARAGQLADKPGMDEDLTARPDDPLRLLARQDLDPLSVAELEARIAALEAEIVRTRAKLDAASRFRGAADALFKKP